MRARLLTFIVLAIAIELIVVGALFFYHGIQKETLEAKVGGLAAQTAKQTREQLQQALSVFEGITQQILINTQLRKDIVGTQTGTYDGVEIKRADTRIREELTALKILDKNIVNIRLISKENYENALDVQYALFASLNSNNINLFPENKEGLRTMIEAAGEPVWYGTKKNGFFFPPDMAETKYFPGNTITLGRLLKNAAKPKAEMLVVMEIEVKTLTDHLKEAKIGENSNLTIVDDLGNIVWSIDPKVAGQPSPVKVAKEHQTGIVQNEGTTVILGEALGKPGWHVLISYQPSEYSSYVESMFKLLLTVISAIVLLVSAGLAWLMNRE
jgi:methyl-accepting chemotaxis protein